MLPIIAHLDMNSYFASVEQQDNFAWRGRPVGVCEHLGGILIAASREAKLWGIGTGTPVWEAKKIYPKILLTHTHPQRYRLYHDRFVKLVSDYTDRVEAYSIDEVFIDLTKACNIRAEAKSLKLERPATNLNFVSVNPYQEAVKIVLEIKRRMKKEVGDWLTVSAGVAPTKLLAKIGSDMQKPDGLTLVTSLKVQVQSYKAEYNILQYSTEELYSVLKLTDIPGIGERQEKRLNVLGIRTLIDLRNYPESKLVAQFGILGKHLHSMGQLEGSWQPNVYQSQDIKSIGHAYTVPKEFREKKFFAPVLYKLSEMVARRLRAQKLAGSTLHFYLHSGDGIFFGKSKRLGYFVEDGREIFLESLKIYEQLALNEGPAKFVTFKFVGVTVSGLSNITGQQSLFEQDGRVKRAVAALDIINKKYGDFTICRVPVSQAGGIFQDSIGFGRIKERVRLASFS